MEPKFFIPWDSVCTKVDFKKLNISIGFLQNPIRILNLEKPKIKFRHKKKNVARHDNYGTAGMEYLCLFWNRPLIWFMLYWFIYQSYFWFSIHIYYFFSCVWGINWNKSKYMVNEFVTKMKFEKWSYLKYAKLRERGQL